MCFVKSKASDVAAGEIYDSGFLVPQRVWVADRQIQQSFLENM